MHVCTNAFQGPRVLPPDNASFTGPGDRHSDQVVWEGSIHGQDHYKVCPKQF